MFFLVSLPNVVRQTNQNNNNFSMTTYITKTIQKPICSYMLRQFLDKIVNEENPDPEEFANGPFKSMFSCFEIGYPLMENTIEKYLTDVFKRKQKTIKFHDVEQEESAKVYGVLGSMLLARELADAIRSKAGVRTEWNNYDE